jgi:hypothetical protein
VTDTEARSWQEDFFCLCFDMDHHADSHPLQGVGTPLARPELKVK